MHHKESNLGPSPAFSPPPEAEGLLLIHGIHKFMLSGIHVLLYRVLCVCNLAVVYSSGTIAIDIWATVMTKDIWMYALFSIHWAPIGSPCGCVEPIGVTIDLDVAPYLLFMRLAELEVEVSWVWNCLNVWMS
jgi:hypothetical protein